MKCQIILLFLLFALCAEEPTIALRELQSESLPPKSVTLITDRIRLELFRSNLYTVMERNEMDALIREQEIGISGLCDEMSCDVELGKMLSVDKVLTGSVGLVDSLYVVTIRLIDVESSKIEKVADVDVEGSLQQLFMVGIPALINELIGGEEVSLLIEDNDSPVLEESNMQETSAYVPSYRERLRREHEKREPVKIVLVTSDKEPQESSKKKKMRVRGPNLIAGVTAVGSIVSGAKLAQKADEYEERAEAAEKGGNPKLATIYRSDAKRRDIAKSVLWGVGGISLLTFVISF